MNFTSVSGKKWIFKKFVDADIKQFSDDFSLSEPPSKLLSIRKKILKI